MACSARGTIDVVEIAAGAGQEPIILLAQQRTAERAVPARSACHDAALRSRPVPRAVPLHQHRPHDVMVAGAAAQIAGQRFANLVLGRAQGGRAARLPAS